MFGKIGKEYAESIAEKVEALTLNKLDEYRPPDEEGSSKSRGKITNEKMAKVNGRRRALFIGINYKGQKNELAGCINDVISIKKFFTKHYEIDECMVLTDDKKAVPETNYSPTRKNILGAMKWLISKSKKGDSLLLHYSGHGSKVKNLDGTEASGYDQTLVPLDFKKAGHILDDDIHHLICAPLPKGVRLTAIFDCCHSESIMDLPYTYNVNGNLEIVEQDKNQSIATLVAAGTRRMLLGKEYGKTANKIFKTEVTNLFNAQIGRETSTDKAQAKLQEQNETKADIIMFSGCKDDQTSADTKVNGIASGAMSYALIKTLTKHHKKKLTYTELLREMRTVLEGKYTQVPQLSAGRRLVLDHPFQI